MEPDPSMSPAPAKPSDKFVWPPPAPLEPPPGLEIPSSAGSHKRALLDGTSIDADLAPPPSGPGAVRGAIDALEDTWLGVSALPMRRLMRERGFAVDPPGAYCGRCGHGVGPYEARPEGCPGCRETSVPWAGVVRLGAYEGELGVMIRQVKYTRWRRRAQELGGLLGIVLRERLEREGRGARPRVIVPVPMSVWRRLSRGIDHALCVARAVSGELDSPCRGLLSKAYRPAQASLPASERRANVRGAMRPARGLVGLVDPWRACERAAKLAGPGGMVVVLVDDVMTTGSTMREACRAVREGLKLRGGWEVEIWVGVLAVTERRTEAK